MDMALLQKDMAGVHLKKLSDALSLVFADSST
jgi:hypothetical protein